MTTETTESKAAAGGSGRRSRSIMAAGLALGLVAGAGASLAAGWPFAAGASTQSAGVTRDAEDHGDDPMIHEDDGGPEGMMLDVLQSLVDDGTLTQEQVDAIIEALTQAHDEQHLGPMGDRGRHHGPMGDRGRHHGPMGDRGRHHGPMGDRGRHHSPMGDRGRHHGPGMGGPERRHPVREVIETAATFLGLDMNQLRAELKSGKTLAEIAEAHGKSRQDLIDALVTAGIEAATERLNDQIPRLVDGEVGPRQNS